MFSAYNFPTAKLNPNLPIVTMPIFTREKIALHLAVHSYGFAHQMQSLKVALKRCGLIAGRHYWVVEPDKDTLQRTLTCSQPGLFSIHFFGAGQVLHAMLSGFQNVLNIAIQVPDSSRTDNIVCRDTRDFPKLTHELMLRFNDDELSIAKELSLIHTAHRQAFADLVAEINKLHDEMRVIKSNAKDELSSAANALLALGEGADKDLKSVNLSRYVALVAALCRACKLANEEKPGLFDRATKQAKHGERYYKLLKQFVALIPTDLNPLQKFERWDDATSKEDKIKTMDDGLLRDVYEKIVVPALSHSVTAVARLGK
jgi:hypothetical protein